jgi:hypothetical protein
MTTPDSGGIDAPPLPIVRWEDIPAGLRADGINLKWMGNDNGPLDWHIGGYQAGAEGAIITGPVKGMVHVDFAGIWNEPAYGPPRYERRVDKRREISTRVALMSDTTFGWFDTESRWWNGMDGDLPGWFCIYTRRFGELYCPMQLLEASQTPLDDDPTTDDYNCQEWDILLAADGEPRWRQPDVRPAEWVNDMSITTTVVRDENRNAPMITVGVGKLKAANRGTKDAWPVYTVTAPGRCWLPNGMSGQMVRVPPLNPGEHVTIDTNPANRIAISDKDPVPNAFRKVIDNSELLSWLFGNTIPSDQTILERFHGQGFDTPIPAGTVGILPVFHDTRGARISVRVPQVFERAVS